MTVDGNRCRNSAYESTSQYVAYQAFSTDNFSSGQVKSEGWVLASERSQTHGGNVIPHTSYSANQCNMKSIAGGYAQYWRYVQSQYSMTKTLTNLPPHYGASINVQFWTGDTWDNESYSFEVDGN